MISFGKKLLAVFLLCSLSLLAYGKETLCYKLVESPESQKIGSIQFISFIGDQCYESDINGISVKNGTMKKNAYQTTHGNLVYIGQCFCGSGKFGFNSDKSILTVISNNGRKYVFKKVSPPTGVTTCALIRERSPQMDNLNENYGLFNPVYPGGSAAQNVSTERQNLNSQPQSQSIRKCAYCNGTGQISKDDNAPSNFGINKPKQQCPICGKWYNPNVFTHYHQRCSHCGGTGCAR